LPDFRNLGKFEIICKLGQGAMGVVYKARDPLINRVVALKTLRTGLFDDSVLLKRFYSEARAAGNLRHPNIVTIYELGHEGDMPFIAMQFLHGESLDKVIERLPNLPLSQRVGFIVHVCRALDYAHKQNPPVIHRDIKPANVVVGPDGSVVVVDFGIARLGEASLSHSSGVLIGTLSYMSPQLFRGGTADAQSDIWATGVMFYELLAYRRPFRGENAAALMSTVVLEEPRSILEAAPGTPEDVERILSRMLAKGVEERYQSMEEVLMDLEPVWKRLLQADISILLENSERLLHEGDLLAARSEIVQILSWDSTNLRAKRVSEMINSELRKQKFFPQLREHVENAQKLLADGHLEEAKSEAQLALKLDSSYEPAAEVVRHAQAALERAREIRHSIQASEELWVSGALTDAESQLDKALALDPSNEAARDHLKQLRDERARRELRKQRDTLLQRARSFWAKAQYEECVAILVPLEEQFLGDTEIRKFLDAAREDLAEQRRQALLVGIRNLLSTGQFEAVLDSLDSFLAQFPSDATAESLRSQALHGRDLKLREQRLNNGKTQLRALMSQGKHAEVIVRGKELQREFPWDSELSELLVSACSEQSQVEQRIRLEQLTGEIQEMIDRGNFGEAIQTAETALSEFPNSAEILTLGERARNEQAEKTKQQLIKRRVRDVERLLKHHQLTDAVDLARQTITTLGNDPRLIAALQQGEKELEFREQKRQRQAETVERAHSLLNDGKLSDAALLLKDAIESKLFSSDDLAVRALFEEIGSRRRRSTGSEPQEHPSVVSEITLVQLGTDPARDYAFLGGTPLPDAAIHAEQRGEIGGIDAQSVRKRPAQPSSASPGVMPATPEIGEARGVREQLDLRAVEKHLAISLGPIASFIVDKTAGKAKNQEEFFSQLASSLPSQKDRQIFLTKKKDFVRVQPLEMPVAKAAAVAMGSENRAVTVVPQAARLNPGDVSKAVELMAHYVGPISGILAERAARRADNLRGFYLILASHLHEGDERSKFLTDAGFPES
jgi:eukaryotic-like serine/threonine-protein kinase